MKLRKLLDSLMFNTVLIPPLAVSEPFFFEDIGLKNPIYFDDDDLYYKYGLELLSKTLLINAYPESKYFDFVFVIKECASMTKLKLWFLSPE